MHAFRTALNPSTLSADVADVGSWFHSLMVLGKNDCPKASALALSWKKRVLPLVRLSFGVRYWCLSMSVRLCWILNSIKLRMEMGNVSKKQQPDLKTDNSRRSPIGVYIYELRLL